MPAASHYTLPAFSKIDLSAVQTDLSALLKDNIETIDHLLSSQTTFTWDSLLEKLETMDDRLHKMWSPIHHMNSVVNTPQLREVVNACLPLLADYHTHVSQNNALFEAVKSIQDSEAYPTLTIAQRKTIDNMIRDFQLSGVHLSAKNKKSFARLTKESSQLSQQFEENVLDATMGWQKHIVDESQLNGLPAHAKNAARELAEKNNETGWIFTLEAPSYLSVMLHAENRALRREMYEAFVTRASDQGPNALKWDNTDLLRNIVANRFELAHLLGFTTYAEYSLATKMVKKPDDVLQFLHSLADKAMPRAIIEFEQLSLFARTELNLFPLEAWDVAYASEKMRQQKYDLSQEDLRPYFAEPNVVRGIFEIIHRLYGLRVVKMENVDVWHEDVTCYRLINNHDETVALVYFDLYAREHKRGGAWMDDCSVRRRLEDGSVQLPIAYVTCNFNAPIKDELALLTHDDVVTLFHECGHALQHMLTEIDVASVSGINGIPWDAVEVASQFFENWAWEKESLHLFARHYQTNALLPDELFDRMQNARHFQTAMHMVRQLEFSLFDFELHLHFDPSDKKIVQSILDAVRRKVSVVPVPAWNRFAHGFSHIFAGGYAAGYYSYKWAEVLACDAFSLFEEEGLFNTTISERFRKTILANGGALEPLDLFIEFRGREPSVDALLRHAGIGT